MIEALTELRNNQKKISIPVPPKPDEVFRVIGKVAKEIDRLSALRSIQTIQKLGYRIVRNSPYYCRACGETVEYGMKFCPKCGEKLNN